MVSPLNMFNNPFARGRSKAAFQGKMNCPFCSKAADPTTTPIGFESERQKIKCVGNVGPFMREYKCGICGGYWRYDFQKNQVHPYDSFKKGLKLPGLKFSGKVPLIGSGA